MTEQNKVKIFLKNNYAKVPTKGSSGAVGFDVYLDLSPLAQEAFKGKAEDFPAFLESYSIEAPANEIVKLPTGFCVELPSGVEMTMYSRSSLFLKKILVQGIVDPDYRGEVHIMFYNLAKEPFKLTHHMRIAQALFRKTQNADDLFEVVSSFENLSDTNRGEKGFGSSGQ